MHSTIHSVACLRQSDVSVICRVTYLQFPILACFSSMSVSQAAKRRTWFTQYPTPDNAENFGRYVFYLYGAYRPGNNSELIPAVKMETRHPVEGSLGSEFPAICNHCVDTANWSRKTLKFCQKFLHFFGKTTPYGKIFRILCRKFSSRHQSTLLCSNVKFVRREIGKIVRYLVDKKISPVSQTVATLRIVPKICQGQPPTMYS